MHQLVAHVQKKWFFHKIDHIITSSSLQLALSGGVDSIVLLHVLNQLRIQLKFELRAIHINDGISNNADYWSEYCKTLCDSLNIELTITKYIIRRDGGESLENNARKIRYLEFAKSTSPLIVLAHHQNDQLETTLSQLFRGSDLHNIAGMQEISHRYGKYIWRPLLEIPREAIEEYANKYNLSHIEDESNYNTTYLRNFIRHDVLPRLLNFDKDIKGKILKLPKHINALLNLVDEIVITDLNECLIPLSPLLIPNSQNLNSHIISLEKLKTYSINRQHNIISRYIKNHNLQLPTKLQLIEFTRQAINCKSDKHPQLKLSNNHLLIKEKDYILIRYL